MVDPPRWDTDRLDADRKEAIAMFRRERLEEPLDAYLEMFEKYQGVFEELLETTVDLTQLRGQGLHVLSTERLLEAFRYLAGPPISTDDLKTVAEAASLNKTKLQGDPQLVKRIIDLVLIALDRRRFPWVTENRSPTEAESTAAVIASASVLATQKLAARGFSRGAVFRQFTVMPLF